MGKEQIEIEKKFVIEMPREEELCKMPDYTRSKILQIYLASPSGITRRIRGRFFEDRTEYTVNTKIRIDSMSAKETEDEISESDFLRLRDSIKDGSSPLQKVRHTFSYCGHTVEIDIYPDWKRTCILEVELSCRDEEILLPDFIRIVRDVTGDKAYSNASMSRKFPPELHL